MSPPGSNIFLIGYDWRMKSKLDSETTPEQKMQHFQSALGRALTLSKGELTKRIAKDEEARRTSSR